MVLVCILTHQTGIEKILTVLGELSALNGIAGAMTEQVKVIHVVGQTTRPMQKNHVMIHHSIGFNPDHEIFKKASKSFRAAEAELHDKDSAPAEIDVSALTNAICVVANRD